MVPRRAAWPAWSHWVLWLATLAIVTVALLTLRGRLDKAHEVLVYLLVVLGGSAAAGRRLGSTLSVLAFLAFNYLFLPPYYTLAVGDPLDWLVLVAFLVTGIVAAELLSRAQRLSAAAERAEAFRQADELKTALLATVSHDLRTPLTTIKALAHQLAARGEEDALSIEEEADRLNRLVADLLDLSRLSAGALPLRIELDAVDDLIATALDRIRGTLGMREVIVSRHGHDAAEPILFARFDLAQSQRALVNLLENASKYSPPAEPIELWVERSGARVRLTVADRGPGVPEQDRSVIFEPFYRPEGVRPDAGGAGLGLAIARRVAESQGGSLTYAARSGGGSEFRFEIPAGTAAELTYVHDHFMPKHP
jgi:K+-sensing histidine kinase KdpD